MTTLAGNAAQWERDARAALAGSRHVAARDAALHAAAIRPADPRTAAGVAALLAALNLGADLRRYARGLGPMDTIPVPLLMALAHQFTLLGDQAQAMEYLEEVHRADPDFPPGPLVRAQVSTYVGRIADARRDLERCLRRAPEIAQAYWLLAKIDAGGVPAGHVAAMKSLLARPGATPADQAFLGFGLHMVMDGLGEHRAAWEALELACRAKRGTLNYDPAVTRDLVDRLCALPVARGGVADSPGGKTPVFIVGMHRSGTTLLEQLLDASPDVRALGELYDFTSAMRLATDHHCRGVVDATIVERSHDVDLSSVGRHYLDGLGWRLGKEPAFVDKLPSNFLNIGFICRALPQAKILHLVRDPMETCFSNLRELFSDANAYSYDQLELADYFLQYRRL